MTDDELLRRAWARFDAVNGQDPTSLDEGGGPAPRELVRARQLTRWVERIAPDASLALRLAARCQHLGRFAMSRSAYPEGRVGYLTWRKDAARRQADAAGEILRELGADEELRAAVRAINLKLDPRGNPDVQTMEDALCLAFLEHEFTAFGARHDEELLVSILQKTWRKMSERGRAVARELTLPTRALALLERALKDGEAPGPA